MDSNGRQRGNRAVESTVRTLSSVPEVGLEVERERLFSRLFRFSIFD
jgi:hypothetical protein